MWIVFNEWCVVVVVLLVKRFGCSVFLLLFFCGFFFSVFCLFVLLKPWAGGEGDGFHQKKKLNSLTESFQETTSDFQKENLKSCGPSEDYEQMYVCL